MYELYNSCLETSSIDKISLLLKSGKIASGSCEQDLKNLICNKFECSNVTIVNNFTSAIRLALSVVGIGQGDYVLCKSFSCLGTTAPILDSGARIEWVDLQQDSTDFCLKDLEEKLEKYRPKALVNYHISGYVDNVESIRALCDKYDVVVINDCNASLHADWNDSYVALLSDFTVYSFYPNRLVNGLDGGALICKDIKCSEQAEKLKKFGIDQQTFRDELGEISTSSNIAKIGWNFTNSNISSALIIDSFIQSNDKLKSLVCNVNSLKNKLSKINGLKLVSHSNLGGSNYWNFLLLVDNQREFIRIVKNRGLLVSSMHVNNYIYSAFPGTSGLPNSESFAKRVVAIPCGWWLSPSDIDSICEIINSAIQELKEIGNV